MKKTIVVNAFAGPGAGKTVASWEIAAELKKRGLLVEYVAEYVKELIWDCDTKLTDGSIESQLIICKEQKHRLDRLLGKVDVIVTDSPILLSVIYTESKLCPAETKQKFENLLVSEFKKYDNFNFFIKRNPDAYETEGRLQNFEEAKEKDNEILNLLRRNNIYFGMYSQGNLKLIANNIERHIGKEIKT